MSSTEDVFQISVSPSVAARTAMLRKQGAHGLSGLASDALPHHFPMQNPRDSNDHDGEQDLRDTTNRDRGLGAIEKSGYSWSSVESKKSSGPPDTGAYKRRSKRRGRRALRAGSLPLSRSVWKVTGRCQERLFRLLKKIPSCTKTRCTKRIALSLEILD